ncbi:MAG TPA: sugar phosphate isomerase/epimerase [Planctomycetota bacterium]|nr:sugar phosphate isomerase/epimerase [Planctomycetota bacterium]
MSAAIELSLASGFDDEGGPIAPRLAMIAAAGFTHVHWTEHWATDVLYEDFYTEGARRALAAAGLRLLDVHNGEVEGARPSSADEAARRHGARLLANRIRFAAVLGGQAVVVHPAPFDLTAPDAAARWAALARSLAEVAPVCRETGVRVALENLPGPAPAEYFRTVEALPPEVAGYCFDSGHANLKGDPDLPAKMGARLLIVHLHDNRGEKDDHAIPGTGTIDWARVLRGLAAAGYSRPLNFEINMKSQSRPAPEFLAELFRAGGGLAARRGALSQNS